MVGWMQELRWVECKNFIKSETSSCLNVQEANFSRGLDDNIDRGASFSLWSIKISLQIVSMFHMNQWNNSLAVSLPPNWILHTLMHDPIYSIWNSNFGALYVFLHMKILEHIYVTYVPMMCRLCTEEFKSHAVKKEAMVTSQGVVKLCWCKLPAEYDLRKCLSFHMRNAAMKLSILKASKDRDSWGVKIRPIYRQIISDLILCAFWGEHR